MKSQPFFSLGYMLLFFLPLSVFSFFIKKEAYSIELLVRIISDHSIDELNTGSTFARPELPGRIRSRRQVSVNLDIWLLEYTSNNAIDTASVLNILRAHPAVEIAQINHAVYSRGLPDDPLFPRQWQYNNTGENNGLLDADIDAPEAWDLVNVDGETVIEDEIVVAVIDGGIRMGHEDLQDNIWVNKAEISGKEKKDDDGNGYEDDYDGWNFNLNNNDVHIGGIGDYHGTPVAGIIGAKGNNHIGVTGVSRNVKLMNLVGNKDEASAIAAYDYVITMRRRYNETGGEAGAFVVATNSSFGSSKKRAEDAPLWCAMYDSLGAVGVLNVASTDNDSINVDEEGDMPSSCPSEYLITVTNTNRADKKVPMAGFGKKSIDLGAPGDSVFTITNTGEYGPFYGTSAAAPHVAGAIALLYAYPNHGIRQEDYLKKPKRTAALMKGFIFAGVDPLEDLKDITVTGGRLNLCNSILKLRKFYGLPDISPAEKSKFTLHSLYPNPAWQSVFIDFTLLKETFLTADIWDNSGRLVSMIHFKSPHEKLAPGYHRKNIDLDNLERGMYFIVIKDNGRPMTAEKIVKM